MIKIARVLAAFWVIATLALVFVGCSTTIAFLVQRPPAMDTLGIQRIAVMPFSTTDNSSLQRRAAAWLTNESLSQIRDTNHFTLINATEVERVRAARGNVEALTDALFIGQVLSANAKDSARQDSYKDKDGKIILYTTYEREVQLAFNYSLTRTRDGSMVSPESKTITINDSKLKKADLRTAEEMIQAIIQQNMAGLGRDLAPYMATEYRTLMKETSKDKIVKQRAKEADALVRARNYKSAQDAFLGIYRDTGSFAAGYNVALLFEVQGDQEGAIAFFQRLYNETSNPQASAEITRLRGAIANAGLAEAYRDNQSRRNRVIAIMVETLPPRMPQEPRIALLNNSQNERELAESVINGMIDGFIAKRITVVDRNNRALVEMERNYQYSGFVGDNEMIRLGHETGVNAFILVAVIGTGGSRHLSVRMIDVERGTILYQSPQSDEMNL